MFKSIFISFLIVPLVSLAFVSIASAAVTRASRIPTNGEINLRTESFGKSEDTPVLLIMGASASGVLWQDSFCEKLAEKGLFVIRYDHRDTGGSSRVDFVKNRYGISDMVEDAIAVLEAHNIRQAHIVGFSLGGQIAEFLTAKHKDKVLTLTIISSSSNFEPYQKAFESLINHPLPPPTLEFRKWINYWQNRFTKEENTTALFNEYFLSRWQALDSKKVEFNLETYKKMLELDPNPALDDPNGNHLVAAIIAISEHKKVFSQIQVPTLVIHGSDDAVFPNEHGLVLSQLIKDSKFKQVQNMGHQINPCFFDEVVSSILEHVL